MKILLTNLAFILSICFVAAQVSIDPTCLILEGNDVEEIYIDINITNSGDEDILAYWEFEPAPDFPGNWKFQICDLVTCYFWDIARNNPSSFSANLLPAGETKKFTLKVQNNENDDAQSIVYPISGSSFGTLRLFDNNEFVDHISTSSCIVSNSNVEYDKIEIYPNPTNDVFQLKSDIDISNIRVFNTAGSQIRTFNHTPGMVHDISDLKTGVYMMNLENKSGKAVRTMRISKQ